MQRIAGALAGAELDRALAGASVVGIRSKTEMRAAQFANHSHLVAVGCFCIGTNQVDLLAAEASGSAVFNSPFSNTRSVAEMTVAEKAHFQLLFPFYAHFMIPIFSYYSHSRIIPVIQNG